MRTFDFVTNRYQDECEICSADGRMRDNGLVLCNTCSVLSETEPNEANFFNTSWQEQMEGK
jgi:hypothetical protein